VSTAQQIDVLAQRLLGLSTPAIAEQEQESLDDEEL
jgi:hypothetical protein